MNEVIKTTERAAAFERLATIMDELRENCPWDKKQTMETLRHLTIEETYELAEAIIENNLESVKKELGDLMLHLLFYARIAQESGAFTISDAMHAQCEKLIFRHPHIYGDKNGNRVIVQDEHEVKRNWEKLKLKEGSRSALAGVPDSLPALIKAMRMQEKARGVGFDWEKPEQVWQKVEEELNEFRAEAEKGESAEAMDEFGDLLFSLINFARFKNINPEEALERTNKKFKKRFQYLESEAAKDGRLLSEMSLDEMDVYWNKAKKLL